MTLTALEVALNSARSLMPTTNSVDISHRSLVCNRRCRAGWYFRRSIRPSLSVSGGDAIHLCNNGRWWRWRWVHVNGIWHHLHLVRHAIMIHMRQSSNWHHTNLKHNQTLVSYSCNKIASNNRTWYIISTELNTAASFFHCQSLQDSTAKVFHNSSKIEYY